MKAWFFPSLLPGQHWCPLPGATHGVGAAGLLLVLCQRVPALERWRSGTVPAQLWGQHQLKTCKSTGLLCCF